jgi:23S rRNA pseudouridine2604 synthase
MRLNRYLAQEGFATRRGADDLIEKGAVTVNGNVAILGSKVNKGDQVEVRHRAKPDRYLYFAFNKPKGMSSDRTLKGTGIMQNVTFGAGPAEKDIFPLSGLDQSSEGLVILTNDRRLIERMQNPAHPHMKEYLIRTVAPVRANFKEKIEAGVVIGTAAPIMSTVALRGPNFFSLRTADNGGHVRQMCAMFFAEVESVKRTRIMNIQLGSLAQKTARKIDGDELAEFLAELGL